jgi:uncharacterized membrane protein
MRHGGKLWERHPHVRAGNELSIGERAADFLKHWFGTWTLLGLVGAFIIFWLFLIYDPGQLHLNLILSCMAAVQGIILQISANRGDMINAELATGTHANTEKIKALISENTTLTQEVKKNTDLLKDIHNHITGDPDV